MMGARTRKTVRLSQAREGYCPKFYIHLVPGGYSGPICGLAAKMFVEGQQSGTPELEAALLMICCYLNSSRDRRGWEPTMTNAYAMKASNHS